jgi:hypothetical protein
VLLPSATGASPSAGNGTKWGWAKTACCATLTIWRPRARNQALEAKAMTTPTSPTPLQLICDVAWSIPLVAHQAAAARATAIALAAASATT